MSRNLAGATESRTVLIACLGELRKIIVEDLGTYWRNRCAMKMNLKNPNQTRGSKQQNSKQNLNPVIITTTAI